MPSNKFLLPTGYEAEQKKADTKRALAKLMLEKGLSPPTNMQSWAQVLASLGQTWAGKGLNKDADKIDSDVYAKEIADYDAKTKAFDTLTSGKNVDPAEVLKLTRGDPMLEDLGKPYADALSHRLSQQEDIVKTPTTYARQGDMIGKPIFDPNAAVIPDGQGGYKVNPVRTTAALKAQGYGLGPAVNSMSDPTGGGQLPPGQSVAPPMTSPPQGQYPRPVAAPGDEPMTGGMDLSLLSPEEHDIMASELARRAGHVSSGNYTLQNDTSVPTGNPLTARKSPAGVTTDGRPYWMVNGVAYDNPEGR